MNNEIINKSPKYKETDLQQVILFDDDFLSKCGNDISKIDLASDDGSSLFKTYAALNKDETNHFSKRVFDDRVSFVLNNVYSNFIYLFRLYLNNLNLKDIDNNVYLNYINDCTNIIMHIYTNNYFYIDFSKIKNNDNESNNFISYDMHYIESLVDSIIMKNYTDFFMSVLNNIALTNNIIVSYFVKDMNDQFCLLRDNIIMSLVQLENEKNTLY